MFKIFKIGDYKATFVTSGRTPLKKYKDCVDLCINGSGTELTINTEEVDTVIKELQENGKYKNFIVSDFIEEQRKREEARMQKNILYWENSELTTKKRKEEAKKIISQIEKYCILNEGYELVYNKLEEMIEEGYFLVYRYGIHLRINLVDALEISV